MLLKCWILFFLQAMSKFYQDWPRAQPYDILLCELVFPIFLPSSWDVKVSLVEESKPQCCDMSLLVRALRNRCTSFPCGQPDPPQQAGGVTLFCKRLDVYLQAGVYLPSRKTDSSLWQDCKWFISLQQQQNALGSLQTINITELV